MAEIELAGFKIVSTIYESTTRVVYTARRLDQDVAVIIKGCLSSAEEIWHERLKREFEIGQALSGKTGIGTYEELLESEEGLFLVMSDQGGKALDRNDSPTLTPLKERLALFITICDAVESIHRAGYIHKGLAPENILFNRANGQVQIIDYGNATALPQQQPVHSLPLHRLSF